MGEFEKTLFRSRLELPYPLNYMADSNPLLAYTLVKISDIKATQDTGKLQVQNCTKK